MYSVASLACFYSKLVSCTLLYDTCSKSL
ncbi:unnamed protein product [Spirodela intermedia]|uniref:Uncharacterized protein n=2 Tax=Spirodela intermedia TaxID=51605 RepID=A0A7I8IAM3_SPIIN|nr:unnamed protein product [Spirodela intermedia]CAA6654766.1 unnamed protein product [Spirodela intermedia]CAA7389435.1 unnamed protein product [Spirodela intermedia]